MYSFLYLIYSFLVPFFVYIHLSFPKIIFLFSFNLIAPPYNPSLSPILASSGDFEGKGINSTTISSPNCLPLLPLLLPLRPNNCVLHSTSIIGSHLLEHISVLHSSLIFTFVFEYSSAFFSFSTIIFTILLIRLSLSFTITSDMFFLR